MDIKKIKDTLAVLESQLDSAYERVYDRYYADQKAYLASHIIKLQDQINKFKRLIK